MPPPPPPLRLPPPQPPLSLPSLPLTPTFLFLMHHNAAQGQDDPAAMFAAVITIYESVLFTHFVT